MNKRFNNSFGRGDATEKNKAKGSKSPAKSSSRSRDARLKKYNEQRTYTTSSGYESDSENEGNQSLVSSNSYSLSSEGATSMKSLPDQHSLIHSYNTSTTVPEQTHVDVLGHLSSKDSVKMYMPSNSNVIATPIIGVRKISSKGHTSSEYAIHAESKEYPLSSNKYHSEENSNTAAKKGPSNLQDNIEIPDSNSISSFSGDSTTSTGSQASVVKMKLKSLWNETKDRAKNVFTKPNKKNKGHLASSQSIQSLTSIVEEVVESKLTNRSVSQQSINSLHTSVESLHLSVKAFQDSISSKHTASAGYGVNNQSIYNHSLIEECFEITAAAVKNKKTDFVKQLMSIYPVGFISGVTNEIFTKHKSRKDKTKVFKFLFVWWDNYATQGEKANLIEVLITAIKAVVNDKKSEELLRQLNHEDHDVKYTKEEFLQKLSRELTPENYWVLGFELGFSYPELKHLERDYQRNSLEMILNMLCIWSSGYSGDTRQCKGKLISALKVAGRNDIIKTKFQD